jgi:hypothetical protein
MKENKRAIGVNIAYNSIVTALINFDRIEFEKLVYSLMDVRNISRRTSIEFIKTACFRANCEIFFEGKVSYIRKSSMQNKL